MKKIANYLPVIIAVFILTACETARDHEINVTTPDEVAPVSMTFPPPPSYGTMPNYDNTIHSASKGSVTIYSLDGAPPAIAPQIARTVTPLPAEYASYGTLPSDRKYAGTNNVSEQIFFKFGSSRLGTIDREKIASFAQKAKFAPVNRVTVEGHASRPTQLGSDSVEAHILNLKESMNRSFAVSKSLMRNGLPNEKIKTVSYGSTQATGDDVQDRRVDMFLGER